MKKIRAVLFDMDGLLLDSEKISIRATNQAAAEMGFEVNITDLYTKVMGAFGPLAIAAFESCLPEGTDVMAFIRRKNELQQQFRAEAVIQPMKGAPELLQWLTEHGVTCVLATSTAASLALPQLEKVGLLPYLTHHLTGDQVTRCKPDPEIYLKAAEAAGIPASECLVLEDSPNGIRSGRAAGCVVGMVPDSVPYADADAPYCDAVFSDLFEVIKWFEE